MTGALLLVALAYTQPVNVIRSTERLQGHNTDGYRVDLIGSLEDVQASYTRFLRAVGKVKQDDVWLTITDPYVNGHAFTGRLYATVGKANDRNKAWIGFKPGDWSEEAADSLNTELEKLSYDFGIVFYREKMQADIDQSQRALQAVERQIQRLSSDERDLQTKLKNNEQELIKLQQSIEGNKLEHAVLLTHIQQNKVAQDSVAISAGKIRQVIEMQKEKQRNVGN